MDFGKHRLGVGDSAEAAALGLVSSEDIEPPPLLRFTLLKRRWVVAERTFAWLSRYRRLLMDYEYLPTSSEAMNYLAISNLMLRRLALRAADGVRSPPRSKLKR